ARKGALVADGLELRHLPALEAEGEDVEPWPGLGGRERGVPGEGAAATAQADPARAGRVVHLHGGQEFVEHGSPVYGRSRRRVSRTGGGRAKSRPDRA